VFRNSEIYETGIHWFLKLEGYDLTVQETFIWWILGPENPWLQYSINACTAGGVNTQTSEALFSFWILKQKLWGLFQCLQFVRTTPETKDLNKMYLVSKTQPWISIRSRGMDFWSFSRDALIDDREMNIFEQGTAWTVMAAPMIPHFVSRNIALFSPPAS